MLSTRSWGFIVGGLMAAAYGAATLVGRTPLALHAPRGITDYLVLAGGPTSLALFTLVAIRWEREAGAALWLGGAAAAMGLALGSGPFLGRYFLGMALVVLPQVVEGSLFLRHGRRPPPPPPARRRR